MRKLQLVGAVCIAALVAASPAYPAFPGQNGKIAHESNEGAPPNPPSPWPYYEIHTVNPDGTGDAQLTTNSVHDFGAAWSSDGSKIAFTSDGQIWTMAADGSGATQLTSSSGRVVPIRTFSSLPSTPNWSVCIAPAIGLSSTSACATAV